MNVYFVLLAYNRAIGKNEVLGAFENFKLAEEEYDKKNINNTNCRYITLKLELVIDEDCLGDDIENLKLQTLKQKWNDEWLEKDINFIDGDVDKLIEEIKKKELKECCEKYGYDYDFALNVAIPAYMKEGYSLVDAYDECIDEIEFQSKE